MRGLLIALACVGVISCAKKSEPVGWRVSRYDAQSGDWTFTRPPGPDGPARKIVATCLSYRWGSRDAVTGSNACSLAVGDTLQTPFEHLDNPSGTYLDIVTSDVLLVSRGSGDDQVLQTFTIRTDEAP